MHEFYKHHSLPSIFEYNDPLLSVKNQDRVRVLLYVKISGFPPEAENALTHISAEMKPSDIYSNEKSEFYKEQEYASNEKQFSFHKLEEGESWPKILTLPSPFGQAKFDINPKFKGNDFQNVDLKPSFYSISFDSNKAITYFLNYDDRSLFLKWMAYGGGILSRELDWLPYYCDSTIPSLLKADPKKKDWTGQKMVGKIPGFRLLLYFYDSLDLVQANFAYIQENKPIPKDTNMIFYPKGITNTSEIICMSKAPLNLYEPLYAPDNVILHSKNNSDFQQPEGSKPSALNLARFYKMDKDSDYYGKENLILPDSEVYTK
jgi:hypothetical protein